MSTGHLYKAIPLHRRRIAYSLNCSYAGHHPVRLRLPPLQRRGIAGCRTSTTTPSGCACHPSTGGELPGAELQQPPRQAAPATPPEEGNHPVRLRLPPLHRRGIAGCRTSTTTPSGCACHPSTGGEYHPVRLRLPPLQRRGIPPRQAAPATPPEEGNYPLLRYMKYFFNSLIVFV